MAWAAKYEAKFSRPIVRQLVAIVQRDQRAALDWVGGANVLAGFVDYAFAERAIRQFPGLLITPARIDFSEESVGSLSEVLLLGCAIAIAHQDAELLGEQIQDYTRAVDAIFQAIGPADWAADLTLTHPMFSGGSISTGGLSAGTVRRLFVAAHDYGELRARAEGFAKAATLSLLVELEEV